MIYGKEFELDQAAGVVRAMGEVHLDLEAPGKAGVVGRVAIEGSAADHEAELKNCRAGACEDQRAWSTCRSLVLRRRIRRLSSSTTA